MRAWSRTFVVASVGAAVGLGAAVVAVMSWGGGTEAVPAAVDGDEPDLAFEVTPAEELADLEAAVAATQEQSSAHLRYRHEVDGEIRQFAVGRVDFDGRVATVGSAGIQLYTDDEVLLQFADDGLWGRAPVDELSAAAGEPVPGETNPLSQLELVTRTDEAEQVGTVEVSGVELARIGAVADVSAARDNIADALKDEDAMALDGPGPPSSSEIDGATLDAMQAAAEAHDGLLPVEVWVDAELRIWRIAYNLDDWIGTGGDRATAPSEFALDLRGFGQGGEVSLPDTDEVVDLDELHQEQAVTP